MDIVAAWALDKDQNNIKVHEGGEWLANFGQKYITKATPRFFLNLTEENRLSRPKIYDFGLYI